MCSRAHGKFSYNARSHSDTLINLAMVCSSSSSHNLRLRKPSFQRQKEIKKKLKQSGTELQLEQELNESFQHFQESNSKKTPPRKRELCFSWFGERSFGWRRRSALGVLKEVEGSPLLHAELLASGCAPLTLSWRPSQLVMLIFITILFSTSSIL